VSVSRAVFVVRWFVDLVAAVQAVRFYRRHRHKVVKPSGRPRGALRAVDLGSGPLLSLSAALRR
jgi:hypothetical protein